MKTSTIAICVLIVLCGISCTFWATGMDVFAQKPAAKPAPDRVDLSFEKLTAEGVSGTFSRTAVPGGWLVIHESQRFSAATDSPVSMVFIPDQAHLWNGKSVPVMRSKTSQDGK